MDPFDSAIELLTIWGNNFKTNFYGLLDLLNPYHLVDAYNNPSNVDWVRWIRIVALIGGYMLLRGWLMRGAAKKQERELAKQEAEDKEAEKVRISANELRGFEGKKVSFEDEDSDEEGKATGNEPQWGKKAKKRQRQLVKKLLDTREEQLRAEQEDDEDKDIMEFLVDYEEGKDGW